MPERPKIVSRGSPFYPNINTRLPHPIFQLHPGDKNLKKLYLQTTGSFSKIVWVFKLTVQHVILNKLRVVDYLRMFTDYSRTFYFGSIDTRTASCDYCIFTSFLGKIIQVFTPHLFFFSTNVMLH